MMLSAFPEYLFTGSLISQLKKKLGAALNLDRSKPLYDPSEPRLMELIKNECVAFVHRPPFYVQLG